MGAYKKNALEAIDLDVYLLPPESSLSLLTTGWSFLYPISLHKLHRPGLTR